MVNYGATDGLTVIGGDQNTLFVWSKIKYAQATKKINHTNTSKFYLENPFFFKENITRQISNKSTIIKIEITILSQVDA